MFRTLLTFDNLFRLVVMVLIGIVGIVALALSYDALFLLASQHGHEGWKAYAWPTLIDLPLVVFTLVMLYAQIRRMGGWTIASLLGLVLAYTGVTVYLNYLESDGSIEGIFVRVSAPVGLFVCTEVLRHLLRFEIERGGKVATLSDLKTQIKQANRDLHQLQQETEVKVQDVRVELNRLIDHKKEELAQVTAQRQPESATPVQIADTTKREAFKICAEWEAAGQSLNRKGAALARELSARLGRKVGRKTGRNLLNEYQEKRTEAEKNGNGPQNGAKWERVIEDLPLDDEGQDALKKSVEHFQDGRRGAES